MQKQAAHLTRQKETIGDIGSEHIGLKPHTLNVDCVVDESAGSVHFKIDFHE